tara:strand:+ start:1088 stop:1273 length:186 start_codon:yes stop_codon:yes gene_type:complete
MKTFRYNAQLVKLGNKSAYRLTSTAPNLAGSKMVFQTADQIRNLIDRQHQLIDHYSVTHWT